MVPSKGLLSKETKKIKMFSVLNAFFKIHIHIYFCVLRRLNIPFFAEGLRRFYYCEAILALPVSYLQNVHFIYNSQITELHPQGRRVLVRAGPEQPEAGLLPLRPANLPKLYVNIDFDRRTSSITLCPSANLSDLDSLFLIPPTSY